jgi:hypothetical protein
MGPFHGAADDAGGAGGVSPSPENVFTSMVPKELKVIHAEGRFFG